MNCIFVLHYLIFLLLNQPVIMCSVSVLFQKTCLVILFRNLKFSSVVQFSSVAQSCLTLCDPMNRSTPGLPVHHQLLEFTQTHVH